MINPPMIRSSAMVGAALVFVAALAGCGPRHPLGVADEDWQAMTIEQRADAHARQAALTQAAAERRTAEAAAQAAEDQARQVKLDDRRRSAVYGERVQCVLSGAEVHHWRRWTPIEPQAFDLVVGTVVQVPLIEQRRGTLRSSTTAHASFDGQTVAVCRDAPGPRQNAAACARLLGTFDDYRRGQSAAIASGSAFLRGTLRCALGPGSGMPNTIILDRRR